MANSLKNILVVEHVTAMSAQIMREAYDHAVSAGFAHVLMVDSTQQYAESELSEIAKLALAHPNAVIIGARLKHHAGKMKVKDPHCALRCYPTTKLKDAKFIYTQQGSEIEVLVRLILKKTEIINFNIHGTKVLETKPAATVSIKQYVREAALSLAVAVASLLAGKTSPGKAAFEVALGVLVGVTPLFGLHTAIIAGLALVFRLNFVHLFIGAQISFPPLFPFLLLGAQQIGKLLETVFLLKLTTAISFLLGSLVLAVVLALIAFVGVYFLKSYLNKKLKD